MKKQNLCALCDVDINEVKGVLLTLSLFNDNIELNLCFRCLFEKADKREHIAHIWNSNIDVLSRHFRHEESVRMFAAEYTKAINEARKSLGGKYNMKTKTTKDVNLYEILNDKVSDFPEILYRDKEINSLIRILSRKTKNNPIIVGEAGVGKTSLVEELTKKIENNEIDFLSGFKVKSLDTASLMAGTSYRGQFEEKFAGLIEDLKKEKSILFIDEMHQIMGLGSSKGGEDLNFQNLLKPLLTSNEIILIGATTPGEFRSIEKDPAFSRRIQRLNVDPLKKEETKDVLMCIKKDYEKHHKVVVENDLVDFIVELSDEFIRERNFPDKAIDVLDESLSYTRMTNKEEIKKIEDLIENDSTIKDFTSHYSEEIKNFLNEKLLDSKREKIKLSKEDVRKVVENISGIPSSAVLKLENRNVIKDIKDKLSVRVKGQENAIEKISRALQRKLVRLSSTTNKKPTVLFLAGSTGVGKTEVAKTISEVILGDESKLIRFDMSEFGDKTSINRLIGSPPGYVGYENEGELTEAIRQNPFSVILLDEFEKATPEVSKLFLQLFDDGILTDTKGRTVDFSNTIILMTSNIGTKKMNEPRISLQPLEKNTNDLESFLKEELKKAYPPEFLNRIDDFIVFEKLDKDSLNSIAEDIIEELKENAKNLGIEFEISDLAIKYLSEKGYSEDFGARPLLRTIQSELEDLLIDYTINNDLPKDKLKVRLRKDKLIIN